MNKLFDMIMTCVAFAMWVLIMWIFAAMTPA